LSDNFLRAYELTVSRPPNIITEAKTITPEVGSEKVVDKEGDNRTVDLDDAVVITELGFKGRIASNKQQGNGQPFTFTLTGFSEETESYFRKNSVVLLKAGYQGQDLPILFAGQIYDLDIDKSQDIPVMKVSCSEGYTPSSAVKVTKSFPADSNVTYQDVLEYLASVYAENRIPLGREIVTLSNKEGVGGISAIDEIVLEDGYNISGEFLDEALSKACSEVGYTSYFNKGRLYIEPKNYTTDTVDEFKIGIRQAISINKTIPTADTNSKDNQESSEGYKFKTFLDGRMDVGDMIDLQIEDRINGTFKVVGISYTMDYEGQEWYNEIEVQANA